MPRHKPDPVASMALIVAVLVVLLIMVYGCTTKRDCRDELRYAPGGMYLQEVCK